MRRIALSLVGLVSAIVWAAGCEVIAGFEDHDFASPKPVDPRCEKYCDSVLRACTGTNAVYAKRETCLGVCADLPPGDPLEPTNDGTVECRTRQADRVDTTGELSYCPQAGPGGAGGCGKNCTAYCTLLKANCPAQYDVLTNCEKSCSALRDTGSFDVVANYYGDTIQCRLIHLSTSTVEAMPHCLHGQLQPTAPCNDGETNPPDCQEFCRINSLACTDDLAVYESTKQCLAVCGALPLGLNGDTQGNTMACRHYHSFNALIDPAEHCAHTGPSGDGHCGQDAPDKSANCVSYCILAEKACGDGFSAQFGSQSACQTDCTARGAVEAFGAKRDAKYKVSAGRTGNTLNCRLLHASQALSDPSQCPSALGQGDCQ